MAKVLAGLVVVLAFGGCHDKQRLRERLEAPPGAQPMRLPVEPDQPSTPPAPALLDTVLPWQQPKGIDLSRGDLVTLRGGDDWKLRYRVPEPWLVPSEDEGVARMRSRLVESVAVVTPLRDDRISLATYAAQLAEGSPIYQYTTVDGHTVYVTSRVVSVAPSDPNAPKQVFHTAVIDVDGHIAKLDVRYDEEVAWRFATVADAITGTLDVHRDR